MGAFGRLAFILLYRRNHPYTGELRPNSAVYIDPRVIKGKMNERNENSFSFSTCVCVVRMILYNRVIGKNGVSGVKTTSILKSVKVKE